MDCSSACNLLCPVNLASQSSVVGQPPSPADVVPSVTDPAVISGRLLSLLGGAAAAPAVAAAPLSIGANPLGFQVGGNLGQLLGGGLSVDASRADGLSLASAMNIAGLLSALGLGQRSPPVAAVNIGGGAGITPTTTVNVGGANPVRNLGHLAGFNWDSGVNLPFIKGGLSLGTSLGEGASVAGAINILGSPTSAVSASARQPSPVAAPVLRLGSTVPAVVATSNPPPSTVTVGGVGASPGVSIATGLNVGPIVQGSLGLTTTLRDGVDANAKLRIPGIGNFLDGIPVPFAAADAGGAVTVANAA